MNDTLFMSKVIFCNIPLNDFVMFYLLVLEYARLRHKGIMGIAHVEYLRVLGLERFICFITSSL